MESTHKEITKLLGSREALSLFGIPDVEGENKQQQKDLFIKRIVEAVSPIIPFTIRNKSLDATYFRTALHLLGAAEIMFSQYETDIRSQANPAGLVGLCNSMHPDIKRSAVHSTGLKPLKDFMKEMKGQYNTSLGLGEPFHNDVIRRERRKGRGNRNLRGPSWRASDSFGGRNSTRAQRPVQPLNTARALAGFGQGNRRQVNPIPLRGRGDCFAFLEGNCRRGDECRYLHQSS